MKYIINVSTVAGHLFATGDTLNSENEAKRAFAEIRKRFPASEGFEVTAVKWQTSGTPLDWQ